MEWEEALLRVWGEAIPLQAADHHCRKAARARQIAEGATIRGMKARLLDESVHCDQLAADADGGLGIP